MLSADARQQALVALAFIKDPRAAQAMAELTHCPIRDVATQGGWWMTYRNTSDWYPYPVTVWTADAPESRPSSLDDMLQRRTLVAPMNDIGYAG